MREKLGEIGYSSFAAKSIEIVAKAITFIFGNLQAPNY